MLYFQKAEGIDPVKTKTKTESDFSTGQLFLGQPDQTKEDFNNSRTCVLVDSIFSDGWILTSTLITFQIALPKHDHEQPFYLFPFQKSETSKTGGVCN